MIRCLQRHPCWCASPSGISEWPSLLTVGFGDKEWPGIRQKERGEKLLQCGAVGTGGIAVCLKGGLFKFQHCDGDLHQGLDMSTPALLLFLRLSSVKLSWKSLVSDYGLRVWISMRCGFPTRRNVFIILGNDSSDNNSFSSEGISIKMEESIKMLYARIYKLGNFLDYCNHLQNWLFRCGIDRFQQLSLTTSTFSDIYSYWSLNQSLFLTTPCCSGFQGQAAIEEACSYQVSFVFSGSHADCSQVCSIVSTV